MKKKTLRPLPVSVAACLCALVIVVFITSHSAGNNLPSSDDPKPQRADFVGPICMRSPELLTASLAGPRENSLFETELRSPIDSGLASPKNISPLRTIWEPGPNFSGVFVDTANDEIVADILAYHIECGTQEDAGRTVEIPKKWNYTDRNETFAPYIHQRHPGHMLWMQVGFTRIAFPQPR